MTPITLEQQPPVRQVRPPALPAVAAPMPAGFWIRTCAHLIDSVLISMIITPILIPFIAKDFMALMHQAQVNPAAANPAAMMAVLHSPMGIFIQYGLPAIAVILLWRWRSATPGKMLLRLKIVDADTMGKPSTSQLIIRFFGYTVSMIPMCLGFFAVAWDDRKQAWHDKMARTLVVQTP